MIYSLYFLLLSVLLLSTYYVFIPYLEKFKFGQNIRKEGPRTHYDKKGTPTMGGILILTSFLLILVSMMILFNKDYLVNFDYKCLYLVLIPLLGYFLIGLIDDILIIKKGSNEGLSPFLKLLLELMLSVVFYLFYLKLNGDTKLLILNKEINISFLYGPLIVLMFLSTTNGANLTDGIDGLLTITSLPIILSFIIISYKINNITLLSLSIAFFISLLLFLFFNFPKAKIFMGDTGSLMIGAFICVFTIMLKDELSLIIFGFVFVIETLSVIIQVLYFKITKGKRLFKMTPIHHHLELSGLSDLKINIIFLIISTIFSVIATIVVLK